MDTTETGAKVGPAKSSLWVRLLVRLGLFGATYIAAAFIGYHLWDYYAYGPVTLGETGREFLDMVGGEPASFIGVLLMFGSIFPVGWYYAPQIFGWGGSGWLALLAYPVYCGLCVAATLAPRIKRRWTFVALYVIFVLLLLVNIKGCTYVGPVDLS